MSRKKTYYGPNEVLAAEEIGEDRVRLNFEDEQPVELPKKMFEVVQTNKPIEVGELRDKRLILIANQILTVLLGWDIKIDEISPLMDRIVISVNEFTSEAENIKMGNPRSERTFTQIDSILRNGKNNKKGDSETPANKSTS